MRTISSCTLMLLFAGISIPPAAAAGPRPAARQAISRLEADAGGSAEVRIDRTTGFAHTIRLDAGSLELSEAKAGGRVMAFLDRYGAALGVDDARSQLAESGRVTDRLGWTHIVYAQRYRNLPVSGGQLRAHLDSSGRLVGVNGLFLPGVSVSTTPTVASVRARTLAVATVAKRVRGNAGRLVATEPTLTVYREGVFRGLPGRDHLVWRIEVSGGPAVRRVALVDAHDGAVVEIFDAVHTINRRVTEGGEITVLWEEGDPLPYSSGDPASDGEVNNMISAAGGIYSLIENLSDGTFRSWNGSDGRMTGVYGPDPSEWNCTDELNAYWNGRRTAFCAGMAVDDIVAHEWGHAYTQGTHDLAGGYQVGALNESFSDILGEMVDRLDGSGLDVPDVPRRPLDCSIGLGNPAPELTIESPEAFQGDVNAGPATFNPAPPWSVSAGVELANDGTGNPTDGCEPLVGFAAGRIALIDRGSCTFVDKAHHAENAGAVGVIVVNNVDGNAMLMGAAEGETSGIPALSLSRIDGGRLKASLEEGLTVRLSAIAGTDPSIRWQMGEETVLRGIRDMWNPNCYYDPAKVSDPLYYCGDGDDGGVHINAGVTNHAFALAVDGGQFNGRTVSGIGLTRAAHVYWRAMSVYQVPYTDFAMHADAVDASCADLVGALLTDPATGQPSEERITPDDCRQLAAALLAVEAREFPECPELRLLQADPPTDIGLTVAFFDDFDGGLPSGWTVSNDGKYDEWLPRDWVWTEELPEGGSGGAFFAVGDAELGNCMAGVDDQSGVLHLESPDITIPTGDRPLLVFDHWVATEKDYDGGNLKISINDGPYELLSGSSFRFNPYNLTLTGSGGGISGNTNPLAGQPAFSGTEGGTSSGAWGQSQVDLGQLVQPGDRIRIRFDFGVDGCNGRVGWYVDNVLVSTHGRTPRRGRQLGR